MRKVFILLACMAVMASAVAQADYEQVFRFEKEFKGFGGGFSIVPYFINGTDNFWFRYKDGGSMKYYIVYPQRGKQELLFDNRDIATKVNRLTGNKVNPDNLGLDGITFDRSLKKISFYLGDEKFSYHLKTGVMKSEAEEWEYYGQPSAWEYSPDSLYILFVRDHNLFLAHNPEKSGDSTLIRLSDDGSRFNSYGQYFKGMEEREVRPNGCWLPNSTHFVIQSEDRRCLGEMYLTDYLHWKRPSLRTYRYAVAGDSLACQYGLKLVDVTIPAIRELDVSKWKDQYVEFLYASQNGKKIYFQRIKRTWDEKELCVYDMDTDSVRVLIHEVDKPFFDYVLAQVFFLNDGKEIVYRSERTGFGHFYLYDGETGQLKRALTSGEYVTGHIQEIDSKTRDLYFYAYGVVPDRDPYYKVLCKTNIDKGGFQILTPENATHKIELSPVGKYIIDNFSRVDTVPRSVLRDAKGRIVLELVKHDIDPYLEKGWNMPIRFKVKAADSITNLYGVMWRPMNFDPNRKYPIISEVYPGPQGEYVPVSFGLSSSYATKLAQLGFVVIQVGHRGGTPIRGKEYQRFGYGNMRDYPLADDRAVIINLAKQYPFIDTTRVGIYGHSGGGAMSTAALLTYPDFYSVAVSVSGNHDNRIYALDWVELNNGVQEIVDSVVRDNKPYDKRTNFKVREIRTNMQLVENCRGHLLLVHGMQDDNVHPAHAMRMVQSLIDAGKNFDMLILPRSGHAIDGRENRLLEHKMWGYFAKYLLNDFSGDMYIDIEERK